MDDSGIAKMECYSFTIGQCQLLPQFYAETRPFGRVKLLWTGRTLGGGSVRKNEGAKKSPKIIDMGSYASKVSVNGVT